MITFTIELNGVKIQKRIPSTWNDLTFGQYLKVLSMEKGNEVEVLSMFTGIEPDTIRKAKISGLDTVLAVLDFLKEPPEFTERPEVFMAQVIPKDITFEALGPYIDCRQVLFDVQGKMPDFVEAYAKYCAIYYQAISSEWVGYDYDKAMQFVGEVNNQPAWEVVGLGSFFITKLLRLKPSTETKSPTKTTPRKKSKRGTKS